VYLPSSRRDELVATLSSLGTDAFAPNVTTLLGAEALRTLSSPRLDPAQQPSDFHSSYHSWPSIASFLHILAHDFSDLAQLVRLGTTSEGRIIWGIRVSRPPRPRPGPPRQGGDNKLGMVISGGQHAREVGRLLLSLLSAAERACRLSGSRPRPFCLWHTLFSTWHRPKCPSPPSIGFWTCGM
jgi:hypothetical protein